MRHCELCAQPFPNKITVDGVDRNLQNRRYCLACSPFQAHNTRRLTVTQESRETREAEVRRKKYRKYQRKTRRARKNLLVEMLGGCCQICGYNRDCPGVYSFHHRDPATKKFDVGRQGMFRRWKELLVEVKKCVLLCCRCHAEVHESLEKDRSARWEESDESLVEPVTEVSRQQRTAEGRRARFRSYQRKSRRERKRKLVELLGGCCRICGYNRDCPGAYSFHHRDPGAKTFQVSERGLLRRWDELLAEVSKCELLCCRCHTEVHGGLHKEWEARCKGQVAQLVEHGPEKAGVVGSSPTLSTEVSL